MQDDKTKIEYLEKELGRLLNWIQAAESKINAIITISIAMLGVLAILASDYSKWNWLSMIVFSVSAIILLLSLLFTALASFPRTKGPKESLIYFGRINEIGWGNYNAKVGKLNEWNYITDLKQQCHRNAEIVTKKIQWVKRSIICLFISLIPWLISIFILYKN